MKVVGGSKVGMKRLKRFGFVHFRGGNISVRYRTMSHIRGRKDFDRNKCQLKKKMTGRGKGD